MHCWLSLNTKKLSSYLPSKQRAGVPPYFYSAASHFSIHTPLPPRFFFAPHIFYYLIYNGTVPNSPRASVTREQRPKVLASHSGVGARPYFDEINKKTRWGYDLKGELVPQELVPYKTFWHSRNDLAHRKSRTCQSEMRLTWTRHSGATKQTHEAIVEGTGRS